MAYIASRISASLIVLIGILLAVVILTVQSGEPMLGAEGFTWPAPTGPTPPTP